jgi:hypothetical protein
MSARRSLPNRREHDLITFEHGGIQYTAGIGHFDNGDLAEVFLSGGKTGSAVESHARDAAIILSLAAQFGTDISTVRRAMTRLRDGSAAGPVGHLLDLIGGAP